MEATPSHDRHGARIVLLALAGALLWMALLFGLAALLRAFGVAIDFRDAAQIVTPTATAAFILTGSLIAYRQLSEAARNRHLAVADRLFEELNSPENIAARRWVFRNLPADPAEGIPRLSPEGRDAVKRVLNSLDHIAFLTQPGWIPEETIMPWINPMIVKAWAKLGPNVEYEARRRGEPDYYAAVRRFAERCVAWRQTRLPGSEVRWDETAL